MTQALAFAARISTWLIANWKTIALLIGANWETIATIIMHIVEAQKTYVASADKKQWVTDQVVPTVKQYTPEQVDVVIDRLVELTKIFGWLPPKKTIAG